MELSGTIATMAVVLGVILAAGYAQGEAVETKQGETKQAETKQGDTTHAAPAGATKPTAQIK